MVWRMRECKDAFISVSVVLYLSAAYQTTWKLQFFCGVPTDQTVSVVCWPIRQFMWCTDRWDSFCGVQTDQTVFVVYRPIRQFLWCTDRSVSVVYRPIRQFMWCTDIFQFMWCTDRSDSFCGVQTDQTVSVVYRPISFCGVQTDQTVYVVYRQFPVYVVYRPIRQFMWCTDRSDSFYGVQTDQFLWCTDRSDSLCGVQTVSSLCGVQTDQTVYVVYRPIRQFLWCTDRSDSFCGLLTDQTVRVVYRPNRQFLWCTDRLDRSCTSAVLARCAGNPVTAATVGLTLGRDRVKGSPTPPTPHPSLVLPLVQTRQCMSLGSCARHAPRPLRTLKILAPSFH